MTYFFVEGQLERKFAENACVHARIRFIGLNGDAVAVKAVVDRIVATYRTLREPCGPIVVIFDREGRHASSEEIAKEAADLLLAEGITAIVGVPDRSIETWMLYDPDVVPGIDNPKDGIKGAGTLKEKLGAYSKATDGPKLLKKCRSSRLRASPSFRALADALDWMNCWWLKNEGR
jgi:hypothetical protein